MRVVIAEDEWLVAEALRVALVNLGYQVVAIARTGTEALDLCVQQRPVLLLMDLGMPDMGGLIAIARIMSSCPLCIIVVTGHPELAEEAEGAGAAGLLTKPFAPDTFAAAVSTARKRFASRR